MRAFSKYEAGLDVLGADASKQETNRAILIQVHNAAQLARSQGAIASIAQALAPATIEAKVYDEMKKKFIASLKDQNVDADVSIVDPANWKPADGWSHIWVDLGFAVGGAGLLMLVLKLFGGRR